jgi:5'-3' exonuclease
MGIYYFFSWFKKRFNSSVIKLADREDFSDINIEIDNLLFDLNGIIHDSCQKIYKYGNYKEPDRLLKTPPLANGYKKEYEAFKDVCRSIEHIFNVVQPKKNVILSIDGVAPRSKMDQQRQRRFKSSLSTENSPFDSCNISPGTKFMDSLSKYIDLFLKKKVTEDEKWKRLKVVFSNEKVPGEGESTLISYVKKYGDKGESYLIHGLDADLIMLALSTHISNFYILREDMMDRFNKYLIINIADVRMQLGELMLRWESEKYEYDMENAIDDFVFLCFLIGNDFLPHIPALEILEDGIDIIIDIYKEVCVANGHLTKDNIFSKKVLKLFLENVSNYEKSVLDNKLRNKRFYFPDELLESCAAYSEGVYDLDIERYRTEYNNKYFDIPIEQVCHKYLEGLQWVLTYYTKNSDFNWGWNYNYYYAPFASDICKYVDTYKQPVYGKSVGYTPFEQLLYILPPTSSDILPKPLNNLLVNNASPLKKFIPDTLEIDLSGKKKEYQGIVLLPRIDFSIIKKTYIDNSKHIDEKEMKRNHPGKIFKYTYDEGTEYFIKDVKYKTKVQFINI